MKLCSFRTPATSRSIVPAVWYWPSFLKGAARMMKPLYSTGSAGFSPAAALRPPNKALKNDMGGKRTWAGYSQQNSPPQCEHYSLIFCRREKPRRSADMAKAYWIVFYHSISDPKKLEAY